MNLKDLNLTEKKLYFEIKDSNNTNSDNLKIKIILKKKYTLENFKIINKKYIHIELHNFSQYK